VATLMAELDSPKPPLLLERTLLLFLKARDRETISGDLLEEYREEKLPTLGHARANFWYFRQVISFVVTQWKEGELMKQLLTLTCFFTVAAGVWLAVMENLLRHPGYGERTAVAVFIALQSLATLLVIFLDSRFELRTVVMLGSIAAALFGVTAIFRTAQAAHFEG